RATLQNPCLIARSSQSLVVRLQGELDIFMILRFAQARQSSRFAVNRRSRALSRHQPIGSLIASLGLDGEITNDPAIFLIVLPDQRAEVRGRKDQRFQAAGDVEPLDRKS